MATPSQNQFDIPKGGYVSFDATSLRQLIINRLNEQQIFTDQNFVGSNLAAIIDIIAYSYNTLIYYLNRTSTESMFTEAQLYENMNRIVKLVDYNPIGFQTPTLTFGCSAQNLNQGTYTIPRYSYIAVNNISYSFNEDITFVKTTDLTTESLDELAQQKLLYQGRYQEYPLYTASGDDYETIIVDTNNTSVDHFNIDVYVKSSLTNTWKQYTKTSNLYLENSNAEKYEIRLNGNRRYEIKFGNDINGKKLQTNDQVAIYYLASDGANGEVGPNALDGNSTPIRYETTNYNNILTDLFGTQYRFLTNAEMQGLMFVNDTASTLAQNIESVEQIRQAAPAAYRSQYRLVTTNDYETFVKTNFANLITDVKAVNNWSYVSGYLKYFYDIGITNPSTTDRALLNQVLYSDSCNFNNIYLIVIPKTATVNSLDYLVPAQKELINTAILSTKMATTETTFIDPIYKAVSFGVAKDVNNFSPSAEQELCEILVTKEGNSRRDNQSIINDVANIFAAYFSKTNLKLGQTLDIRNLTQQILDVDGVASFETIRTDDSSVSASGLSLFVWNPIYPDNDKQVTQNNVTTNYFEYLFFNNIATIQNKIKIKTTNTFYTGVEY